MTSLDKAAKKYFWDVNFENLNLKKYKHFVIERILENGDEDAVKWLRQKFSRKDIITSFLKSRRISDRSRNYWAMVFKIALWKKQSKRLSAQRHTTAWSY